MMYESTLFSSRKQVEKAEIAEEITPLLLPQLKTAVRASFSLKPELLVQCCA